MTYDQKDIIRGIIRDFKERGVADNAISRGIHEIVKENPVFNNPHPATPDEVNEILSDEKVLEITWKEIDLIWFQRRQR